MFKTRDLCSKYCSSVIFGFVFFYLVDAAAQCSPSYDKGRNPGASINIVVLGNTPWEFPYPSTQASNDAYTNMRMGTVLTSHYLSVYDWGYGYSTGTICGIKVRVEKAAPATNPGIVRDLEARLYNGASYSPNNYADVVNPWPTTDTYVTYGGNSDLWGFASITAAQLNSVGFAFRFRAQRTDVNDSAKIDHVEVTSNSDELLPVELISFDAFKDMEKGIVRFTWKCGSETNNDFFTLQRSKDLENWMEVAKIQGAGNSSMTTSYEVLDEEPFPGESYYRLIQTDYDGTTVILDRISIRFKSRLREVMVYPTVASEQISIRSKTELTGAELSVTDISGRELMKYTLEATTPVYEYAMDVSHLRAGVYFVKIAGEQLSAFGKFVKE